MQLQLVMSLLAMPLGQGRRVSFNASLR